MRPIPFITIPMFYANAIPHIGHLYSAILGDSIYRWKCLRNNIQLESGIFAVGTDEHGLKVYNSSISTTLSHCNKISNEFRCMFDAGQISYTQFLRTTSPGHRSVVVEMWQRLAKNGCIIQDKFNGWYCEVDECFYSDREVVTVNNETKSKETGGICQWIEETNYFLQIESLKPKIQKWLLSDSRPISSRYHLNIIDHLTKMPSRISLSRPSARCSWGIPVPGDTSQIIYVWFDALASYLESAGWPLSMCKWPPDVQIIGKDIIRFHSIFWAAILFSLGLDPPTCIHCHGHWLNNNLKMSKSAGNVAKCPLDLLNEFSSDGLRYALMRFTTLEEDTNFDEKAMKQLVNAELANNLGNLLKRATSIQVNPRQTFERPIDTIKWEFDVIELMDKGDFCHALTKISDAIRLANLEFQRASPWTNNDTNVVSRVLDDVRKAAILLQPITPVISKNILNILGQTNRNKLHHLLLYTLEPLHLCNTDDIVFKRIE